MKVTLKMNKIGHIEVWKNPDAVRETDKEADLYIQAESDIEAIKDEIGENWAKELDNGWTVVYREIDDLWFPDNQNQQL